MASEAEQLMKELETALGGQNTGTSGAEMSQFLATLADLASNTQNSTTTQPAQLAHPFRQLRVEIHRLRHSTTPDQAALLLLSALTASESTGGVSPTSTGTSGGDLLLQVQNLLEALRSMNMQAGATTGTSPTQ